MKQKIIMDKKVGFTEEEKALIGSVCSIYDIRVLANKDGVFRGTIPKGISIVFNEPTLLQLINSSNVVCIEGENNGTIQLTILAR